jgi:hypothetical protein
MGISGIAARKNHQFLFAASARNLGPDICGKFKLIKKCAKLPILSEGGDKPYEISSNLNRSPPNCHYSLQRAVLPD